MTEEEKAELAAKQDAEFEASLEGLSDEEKETKRAEKEAARSKIDYEAELKKLRGEKVKEEEARKKAEKALADAAFREREKKRQEEELDNPDRDDDKPLTAGQLETILSRERQMTQTELQRSESSRIIKSKTTSEAEASLVDEIFGSMTFPSHYTLEDKVDSVIAVANRSKLIGERNEAMRALRGRQTAETGAAETHHDAPKAGEPKLPADELQVLKQQGFSWNPISKLYEKKLSGGRMLVRDPKDKKVRLVK